MHAIRRHCDDQYYKYDNTKSLPHYDSWKYKVEIWKIVGEVKIAWKCELYWPYMLEASYHYNLSQGYLTKLVKPNKAI